VDKARKTILVVEGNHEGLVKKPLAASRMARPSNMALS